MARGYSGSNALLDVDFQYEYQGHFSNSFEEVANLMAVQLSHPIQDKDLSTFSTDFEIIKENMVRLAREFLQANGNVRTEALLNSIQGKVEGNSIVLTAPATDPRNGHPYAGHIEYGFTDRVGVGHGPWPFLRPAVHLAAQESTGMLGDHLVGELLQQNMHPMLNPTGRMAFGRANARLMSHTRINEIVRATRRSFGGGRKSPYTNRNTKQWNFALHGIKADNAGPHMKWDSTDKKWGAL